MGDVNTDGVADLIWQLPTGQAACWFMNTNVTRKAGVNTLSRPASGIIKGFGN